MTPDSSKSAAICSIEYLWRYPPSSPPGSRPYFSNSAPTHSEAMSSPGLGVFRPIMESCAMTPVFWKKSSSVMEETACVASTAWVQA